MKIQIMLILIQKIKIIKINYKIIIKNFKYTNVIISIILTRKKI